MKLTDIVLASSSPRRREILARLGIPFRTVTPDADENICGAASPEEYVMQAAFRKNKAALDFLRADGSLSAETLLVACDVYRPAAIKQLNVLADENNINFYTLEGSKDVLQIIDGAINYAKEKNNTVLILDTAGRLQIDLEMMAELMLIERSFKLNEKLLVIDSMTGQEAVDIARNFDEQLGITGVILTKLDGDTRGGAALSVVYSKLLSVISKYT